MDRNQTKQILEGYKDDFDEAENPDMGKPLKDGNYIVEFVESYIKEGHYDVNGKRKPDVYVFKYVVAEDDIEYAGRWIWQSFSLGKDKNGVSRIKWLKGALSKMGFDPMPDLVDLPDYLDSCIGWLLKVKLKTSEYNGREFQNVNIIERIETDGPGGSGLPELADPETEPVSNDGDEDIPF